MPRHYIARDLLDHIQGSTGPRIRRAFAAMAEVERLMLVHWPNGGAPRWAFLLARPTEPVADSTELVTAHVAELFTRMREMSDPLSPGQWKSMATLTRAEVIGLFVAASLRHPLQRDDALVYELAFAQVFPKSVEQLGIVVRTGKGGEEDQRALEEWCARVSPERAEWIRELKARAA